MNRFGIVARILSMFKPVLLEERKGDLAHKLEVRKKGSKLILDSSRANYSFDGLHAVMQKAISLSKVKELDPKQVLILGFGAGSCASILIDELGLNPHITGVEYDSQVIDLGKKYFNVARFKQLDLIHQDAFEFVQQSRGRFDLIIIDLFLDLTVPDKFYSEEFLCALQERLSEKGVILFNVVIYAPEVRQKAHRLFEDLNKMVGPTEWHRIHSSGTENWVFASRRN